MSFSGAEDVVLVDMAWKLNRNVKVFSLDTGRLHPETYRFIDQV
ncbi:phosphoadenosine phosphosulfate reductase family protein, partial [Escherichia coli]|nr:phosphoadenosine phosphosulfate reductase family protein [Escherichia coli]